GDHPQLLHRDPRARDRGARRWRRRRAVAGPGPRAVGRGPARPRPPPGRPPRGVAPRPVPPLPPPAPPPGRFRRADPSSHSRLLLLPICALGPRPDRAPAQLAAIGLAVAVLLTGPAAYVASTMTTAYAGGDPSAGPAIAVPRGGFGEVPSFGGNRAFVGAPAF